MLDPICRTLHGTLPQMIVGITLGLHTLRDKGALGTAQRGQFLQTLPEPAA